MLNRLIVCVLILSLGSCASNVMKRNHKGRRAGKKRAAYYLGVKKKIILLDFFNESPYGGKDLAVTATQELKREILLTRQYTIARTSSSLFGTSKEVYAGGGSKLVQMARKAKNEGINFVVYGRVIEARIREKTDEIGIMRQTKAYTESKVEIRIFDVNASKEIFTDTIKGYADDSSFRFFAVDRESKLNYRRDLLRYVVKVAIRRAIPKIAKIAEKLEWVGRVARIIGTKVYINSGRSSGLNIGDILKVITEGVEIFDPETGALIGVSKGQIRGTIEIIDYIGPDASIAILHSGGTVNEGDFVQLY